MRMLVNTFLLGASLVASAVFAQQHPRGFSGYTGSVDYGQAPIHTYGRIRNGDIIDSSGWLTAKPAADELYDDACQSSHSVFSCPGTP